MYICTQKTECFNATRNRKQKHDSDTISHRQRTADDWGINYVFRISRISPLFHARDCALTLTTALKHSLNDFINSTCKYLLRITRLTLSFLLTSIFFTIWHNKKHLFFSRSCILTLRKCRVNRLSDFRIKGIIANYWAIFKQKYSIVDFLSFFLLFFFLSFKLCLLEPWSLNKMLVNFQRNFNQLNTRSFVFIAN